ncbi:DUF397 domain-containing protein [Nonomuraea sp. NPDC046802]|uniref:DUF397 domain-containing protein n=1 Tax=Nonomuraea sp. NPDC046802 TaxID=3154919 RepID=UPI0033C2F3E4
MDLTNVNWRKSSRSGNGASCVEIAAVDAQLVQLDKAENADRLFLVRDSKDPDGSVLAFTPAEWHAFAEGLKDGEFDELN